MAIAKVGAFGAVATGATSSITPTFGQATTAGSLLVACVSDNTVTTSWTTASPGWVIVQTVATTGVSVAIFYKANCSASEANPTFTNTGSGASLIWGVLSEWSGAATTSPLDQSGGGSQINPSTTGNDTNISDLAIGIVGIANSKSATATFTESWTPAGGTAASIGNSGGTKAAAWMDASSYLLNGHGGGAHDSVTITPTPSTGVTTGSAGLVASFLPASTPYALPPERRSFAPHIRASHWFSSVQWKRRGGGLFAPAPSSGV